MLEDPPADPLGDLGDERVPEASESVDPVGDSDGDAGDAGPLSTGPSAVQSFGKPWSHSTNVGFSEPPPSVLAAAVAKSSPPLSGRAIRA
jgi:hypothetical protein